MGYFCFHSAIIGLVAMMFFAFIEFLCNDIRVKSFANIAKKIAAGIGLFGLFFVILATFG